MVAQTVADFGRLAVWLKEIFPDFLDWLVIKVFLEPAIRRARAAQAQEKQRTG